MNLNRFTEIFGVELPIIQAPMAGSSDAELAIAVSEAGGLGSLPCGMLTSDQETITGPHSQRRCADDFLGYDGRGGAMVGGGGM
jgi:NAD(P)H-dependent flavin oxidoreductase YrpB (nitropropane dioxygenase family)